MNTMKRRRPGSTQEPGTSAQPAGRHAARAGACSADAPGPDHSADPESPEEYSEFRDPLIVDVPVTRFEPAPQRTRPHVPDTVCDGWSAAGMTVRYASVRGYSHRYHGIARQDAADITFEDRSAAVVFAVADGVSGASRSDRGAAAACRAAVRQIRRDLASGQAFVNWPETVQAAADAVIREAARMARRPVTAEEAAQVTATTLVTGYLMTAGNGLSGAVVGVGDSGAWILRDDRYHALLGVKTAGYLISSAVSALPRLPEIIEPTDIILHPGAVLLVGTDGFADPLGDGDGLVGQLFAGHLRTPPPPLAFAHLLDFSRETFDDDRTLLAIWPRPGGDGTPG